MPTDTLYGIVGSALNKKAVARIYKLRKRDLRKPMIILVSSIADIEKFGVILNPKSLILLRKLWPGKISVILPCPSKKFFYLHRGKKSLAFRMPAKKSLIELLKITGPLVAPSANWEGLPPAKTIKEAKKYFGDKVYPEQGRRIDFYVDGGELKSLPSTLVELKNKKIILKREGAKKFKK